MEKEYQARLKEVFLKFFMEHGYTNSLSKSDIEYQADQYRVDLETAKHLYRCAKWEVYEAGKGE